MKYYQEITLLFDLEKMPFLELWEKVFTQLHLGLVESLSPEGTANIGLGFPEYKSNERFGYLGEKIRLFARDQAELETFNASKHLGNLLDYVHIKSIIPVPEMVKSYVYYQRARPKRNKEYLARHYAKRKNIPLAEAQKYFADYELGKVALPHIQLKSLSGGRKMDIYIRELKANDGANFQGFSSYGLSRDQNVDDKDKTKIISALKSAIPKF